MRGRLCPDCRVVTYLKKKGLEMGKPHGNKGEGLDRWTFTLLEEDGDTLSMLVP